VSLPGRLPSNLMELHQPACKGNAPPRSNNVADLWARFLTNTTICRSCIEPLVEKTCKMAWKQLMKYCDAKHDAKTEGVCERWKKDPSSFLLKRVLRAGTNPIDAAYKYAATFVSPVISKISNHTVHPVIGDLLLT
jgi:hypothetical protein